jgi:hypothetical protein
MQRFDLGLECEGKGEFLQKGISDKSRYLFPQIKPTSVAQFPCFLTKRLNNK